MSAVKEGELLWTPSAQRVARANLTHYMAWLAERGRSFDSYTALWQWSVDDLEGFWGSLWEYFDIRASRPYDRVLGRRAMPGAEWFPGARLNYAEHALRHERAGADALLFLSERQGLTGVVLDRPRRAGSQARHATAQDGARARRPGGGVFAELTRGGDRDAGDGQHRRHLGELRA